MRYLILGLVALATMGCANTYYYQGGKKQELELAQWPSRSASAYDFYKTKSGAELGVSDTILVKFYNIANIEHYAREYELTILEELIPYLYKIQVRDKSMAIDIANKLYEKEDVEYAHPNFLQKVKKR